MRLKIQPIQSTNPNPQSKYNTPNKDKVVKEQEWFAEILKQKIKEINK